VGQRSDELSVGETNVLRSHHDSNDEGFETKTADAREEIELTRTEMTTTIEAIQDRLNPEVLSEQAKDTAHDVTDYAIREAKVAAREITEDAITQASEAVREVTGQAKLALRKATVGKVESMARSATDTAGGWRQSIMETIRANPMPTALVGLGVGWMLLNRPNGSGSQEHGLAMPRGYRSASYAEATDVTDRPQDKAGEVVNKVQDTTGAAIDQLQGTAGDVMSQVQQAGGHVVDDMQEQASRAQSFLQQQLDENPLIVGVVAVAVGGVLASTVRSTPREDQLLGDARDRVMQAAQEVTRDTADKVSRVVDQAQSAASDEARKQDLVPETQSGSV
jgi:hypothetical protein